MDIFESAQKEVNNFVSSYLVSKESKFIAVGVFGLVLSLFSSFLVFVLLLAVLYWTYRRV